MKTSVYNFKKKRNLVEELPEVNWQYGLGIDLGFSDATALVVICCLRKCRKLTWSMWKSITGLLLMILLMCRWLENSMDR